MRYAILCLAVVLCPLHAAPEWLKFTSANFEMYTTAGETEARRTLEYFEQVRDFFMRVKSQSVTTRLPVTIVAFKNQKEYKPYSPRETASAYFTGDEQRDYIVLGGVGSEHYPTAVHEYMHLLIRHSGLHIPSWLNEGLAEVHSTIKPLAGQILLGAAPQGRGNALGELKWIPLDRLLTITQDSSEFNEKNRTTIFYSQSWLLTHMLMLDKAYASGFGKFVADLSGTQSAEGALQRVYGKSVADVQRDLLAYYRAGSLTGVLFDVKLQKIAVTPAKPATELETGLTLAKLTALLRRTSEARTRYDELAKAHPDSWEIYEALAHLYWQEGDREQAKGYFRRALKLDPPSWKTYWDFARMAHGETGTVEALRSVIRLNPAMQEARLILGSELYRGRNFQETYDVLAEVRQVTPDRAPHLFLMKAFSAMEIGKQPEARAAAELAKKYAKTPEETEQAERLLAYIDRKPREQAQGIERTQEEAPPEQELIPPRPSGLTPEAGQMLIPADLSQLRGVLLQIDCLGTEARVVVLADGARVSLLIRDPAGVLLRNSDDSTVDMTCGPQPRTGVLVGFRAKEDGKFKTTGDVVTLEFLTRAVKR